MKLWNAPIKKLLTLCTEKEKQTSNTPGAHESIKLTTPVNKNEIGMSAK